MRKVVLIFDTFESVLKKIFRGSGEKHQKNGNINPLQVIVSIAEQMHHLGALTSQADFVVLMCLKLNQ
jgi:hypothetical protein